MADNRPERWSGISSPHSDIIRGKTRARRHEPGAEGETHVVSFSSGDLKSRLREAGDAYNEKHSRENSHALNRLVREGMDADWTVGELARAAHMHRSTMMNRVVSIRQGKAGGLDDA